ncbi:MAG: DnaT-like ssDNA-binding domain-containing protein [Pseudohongiellaceae bacterium]|nr:DnaT-like ssDNA-binding domain-containing protein [Pseudohongiellaceae bacterium]
MQSSLIPERPLVISPTLAQTIGLEEAVMLHVLSELMAHRDGRFKNGLKWVALSQDVLAEAFPFWALIDLKRVQGSLQELGLILVEDEGGRSYFAINQKQESSSKSAVVQSPLSEKATEDRSVNTGGSTHREIFDAANTSGASRIPPDWQPGQDWIKQCKQHNIPEDFIRELVPGFVLYWRDRGDTRFSWGNSFYKWAVREWRQAQSRKGAREIDTLMSPDWLPSSDAMSILENAGINRAFIEDAVPEFVLYWRERGAQEGQWNTRFIDHIRRQWAKYSSTVDVDNQPRIIPADWQPSAECFDILSLAQIDESFAREKVKEFVLYWRDAQQAHASWNTRFLQYIKYQWARRLENAVNVSGTNAINESFTEQGTQAVGKAYKRFTDRSWAE